MTLLAAFQVPPRALLRPGRHPRRHADRRPQPGRDGGADRVLRQHARAACRSLAATRRSASSSSACGRRRSRPSRTRISPSRGWSRRLRPERSLAHSPIFQAMFELDNAPAATPDLAGLEVEPVELPDTSAKFDLRLLAIAEESGLLLVFEYATDLFDEATVARMAANFETLLEGIVADPDRPVSRLPMLSEQERRRLLVRLEPDTQTEYPREKCLHELFEEQAGTLAGRGRGRVRGGVADLSGARRGTSGQLARAPAGSRRRPGSPRRALRAALARDGRGPARCPQGGRRLRPARSDVSRGAPRLDARRLRRRGARDRRDLAGRPAGLRRPDRAARRRPGTDLLAECGPESPDGPRCHAGEPRLRDVHVGVDGTAQGRHDPASRTRELPLLVRARLRHRGGPRRSGPVVALLRPDGHRALRSPALRTRVRLLPEGFDRGARSRAARGRRDFAWSR